MFSSHKKLGLLVVSGLCMVLFAGCNETLRQFIVPIPKPTGEPGALAHAVVLSTNPVPGSLGSTVDIDVSGDNVAATFTTGLKPAFLGKTLGRALIINGDGTLSSYITPFLITAPVSFPTVNTVTLPTSGPDAATTPVFVGTSSSSNAFLANRDSDNVSVISASLAETQAIPLATGAHPVAIAGNAANSKIYIVNNGTNDVTVVSTTDNTIVKQSIPVGIHPIWGVMAANGVQVFIVNQGDGTVTNPGSVSVIDTTLDTVIPCTPGSAGCSASGAISVGATPATSAPNFAFYDSRLQRLYVTNTGENTVSVIKADSINLGATPPVLPSLLKNIMVSGAPLSVAALGNGSKVYAALANCTAGPAIPPVNHTSLVGKLTNGDCVGSQLSVIDPSALVETKTIQVGKGAVSVDVSSDSSRAYVVSAFDITTIRDDVHKPNCVDMQCLTGPPLPDRTFLTPSVYIIKTSTDTIFVPPTDPSVVSSPIPSFHVPAQDPNCVPAIDPNFNDDVPLPCVGQTPFVVRVFP